MLDLDDFVQWALHWGNVVFSEDDDGAFSYAVTALAPFVWDTQLV